MQPRLETVGQDFGADLVTEVTKTNQPKLSNILQINYLRYEHYVCIVQGGVEKTCREEAIHQIKHIFLNIYPIMLVELAI